MIAPLLNGRQVRVVIRNLRITSGSPLEARRLGDAMSRALERAFGGGAAGPSHSMRSQGPADSAASQIVSVVETRLRRRP